jgi:N-acylneuraminate cytidylyltransferase
MNVAVIPARGGSKRIPRKNIRTFCGRPMLAWTIGALRDSGCFSRIVLSTDDDEIAAVARQWGAEVPFRRPGELADDQTATLPVVAHAVRQLAADGVTPDAVCCAYATAPMMSPHDVRQAKRLLDESGADYVFSCTTFAFPVQRALRIEADGGVVPMFAATIGSRSQDLPQAVHDAGQFYWGRAAAFERELPIFSPRSRAYMVPRHRVQDIDTEEDWARAERLFLVNQNETAP